MYVCVCVCLSTLFKVVLYWKKIDVCVCVCVCVCTRYFESSTLLEDNR